MVRKASLYVFLKCVFPVFVQVEVEKKDSDEEPMEMVVEKLEELEQEAQTDPEEKQVGLILVEKMAEDLKPMDTDKECLTESKSPEEPIQEDPGCDIAPMQTDDQLKLVPQAFVSFLYTSAIESKNKLEFPTK